MLNEKLAKASGQTKKRHLQLVLGSVALLVVTALVLLNITLFDMLPGDSDVASGSESSVPSESVISDEPESASSDEPPTLTQQGKTLENPDAATADDGDREAFKSLLREFEETIEPSVKAAEFASWDLNAQQSILQQKQDSIIAFAQGNYAEAVNLLEKASEESRGELNAKNTMFDVRLESTIEHLNNDNYQAALQSVNEALQLEPHSVEALSLKQAVEDLPAILAILADIDVARVENNLEAEIYLINQVLSLDPDRAGLKERAETLRRTLREQRFSSSIASGMQNVDHRKLKQAENDLARAVAIYSNRPEATILSDRIATLKLDLEVERLLEEAEDASVKDQWQQASALFGKARDLQPANQKAVEGHALASSISSLSQTVSAFLSAPHRLSSTNVSKLARASLEEGRVYIPFSPTLNSQLDELDSLIILYDTPIDIQVLSDGLTEVAVRGVGRVGKVQSKVIRLKPGTYSFEGKCAGFEAVLVKVEVPPGSTGIDVRVVCDEQV